MSRTPQSPAPRAPLGWHAVPVLVVGLTALLVAMLTAFVLPAVNSGPHKVPIAIAGPERAAALLAEKVDRARPSAFDISLVDDARTVRQRIDDREIYGAVVLGNAPGTPPEVLVASTASPPIAATLRALAPALAPAPAGAQVAVRDLHPLPAADPNGVGLSAGALPLVLGGYLAAILIVTLLRAPAQRAATAFGFALTGGFVLTAVLRYGFDVIDGNYPLTSLAVAFSTAATCWTIMGLRAVLGAPGLGLGAAMMIFLGNPLSGLAGGPEWLPSGWGTFGQFLPPGAGGTLLRSMAFFDGTGSGRALLVLAAWLAFGLALFVYGSRHGEPGPRPDGDLADRQSSGRKDHPETAPAQEVPTA